MEGTQHLPANGSQRWEGGHPRTASAGKWCGVRACRCSTCTWRQEGWSEHFAGEMCFEVPAKGSLMAEGRNCPPSPRGSTRGKPCKHDGSAEHAPIRSDLQVGVCWGVHSFVRSTRCPCSSEEVECLYSDWAGQFHDEQVNRTVESTFLSPRPHTLKFTADPRLKKVYDPTPQFHHSVRHAVLELWSDCCSLTAFKCTATDARQACPKPYCTSPFVSSPHLSVLHCDAACDP